MPAGHNTLSTACSITLTFVVFGPSLHEQSKLPWFPTHTEGSSRYRRLSASRLEPEEVCKLKMGKKLAVNVLSRTGQALLKVIGPGRALQKHGLSRRSSSASS